MPEGPEVREFYLYMKDYLIGNTINKLTVLSGKYLKTPIENINDVVNIKVKDVFIKGKTIFVEFEDNHKVVGMSFVHGMTGNWSDTLEKHSRLFFDLKKGPLPLPSPTLFGKGLQLVHKALKLYYNDTRNFGTIKVYKTLLTFEFAQTKLGPDVLDDKITYDLFYSRINKKPRSKLGVILLDQNAIAGIGNYLRCDIIWYTKMIKGCTTINHERLISSLNENEKKCLYDTAVNMCRYQAGLSNQLEYEPEDYFFVYNQDYDKFGNEVLRETFRGRTIHYINVN
jgi:formamidopyrimidine-DNA glycosylase